MVPRCNFCPSRKFLEAPFFGTSWELINTRGLPDESSSWPMMLSLSRSDHLLAPDSPSMHWKNNKIRERHFPWEPELPEQLPSRWRVILRAYSLNSISSAELSLPRSCRLLVWLLHGHRESGPLLQKFFERVGRERLIIYSGEAQNCVHSFNNMLLCNLILVPLSRGYALALISGSYIPRSILWPRRNIFSPCAFLTAHYQVRYYPSTRSHDPPYRIKQRVY